MERLDKILAGTGYWSRREVKLLCKAGRVTVDGAVVRKAEEKVSPESVLAVDGKTVELETWVWIMLHKPAGLLSATEDARQATVLSMLPECYQKLGLFPVGRLDKDTEGLLLLTNDGALAHDLLSPKKHVDKIYYVETDGVLEEEDCAAFTQGITLADGYTCLPAGLKLLGENRGEVTLREGKYHQIKRMLASRGKPVTYLKRIAFGPLQLDAGLAKGEWRSLTGEEQEALRAHRS